MPTWRPHRSDTTPADIASPPPRELQRQTATRQISEVDNSTASNARSGLLLYHR